MVNKFFSPLEQFDSVTFIKHTHFSEASDLYSFYILESEYNLVERLINDFSGVSGLFFFNENP